MTQSEVIDQVGNFNSFANKKLWLDFDLVECTPQAVMLHCGIDLSVGPDIEINFDTVFFASLLMTWKTDTSSPVLRVVTGEEAKRLNERYRIEHGYHLFAFQPEDLTNTARCLIAAKLFTWRVPA